MSDPYPGTWILISELCIYEDGVVPASGVYEIRGDAASVAIAIAWRDLAGASHRVESGGPTDGSRQPSTGPGVTHASFSRVDARTLDSAAFAGDAQIAWARRCASADGSLLSTVQQGRRAGGSSFRNFQVYRRQER